MRIFKSMYEYIYKYLVGKNEIPLSDNPNYSWIMKNQGKKTKEIENIYRRYYTVTRGYEFYVRVATTISHE